MALIQDNVVPLGDMAKDGNYDQCDLEEACETLARAEEIKADPKMMKALQPMLDKKKKAYTSLADMRDMAAKMKIDEAGAE